MIDESQRSDAPAGRASRFVLAAFAVVFAAPVVYAILNYSHYGKAPTNLWYVVWVILPILAVACGLLAWLARPARRAEIALLLISCIVGLYLVEGVITWLGSIAPAGDFDRRSKLEVIRDLAEEGTAAYPLVWPAAMLKEHPDGVVRSALRDGDAELLPLGGISNRTTIACNESGEYLIYVADEHGFHNQPGAWNLQTLDVAAVGDSFTHGFCVASDENYVALIREQFPATLNLGQSGNGPLLNLAAIREFLPELKPRHVLWFHFEGNDFTDLETELRSPLLMRYLQEDFRQDLRARQETVDSAYIRYIEARMKQHQDAGRRSDKAIRYFVKLTRLRSLLNLTFGYEISPYAKPFAEILANARRTVESWGGQLHFVFVPGANRYRAAGPDARETATRNQVLAKVGELGIPIIDIHEIFARQLDPSSFYARNHGTPMGGHFTRESNRLVANAVLDALNKGR